MDDWVYYGSMAQGEVRRVNYNTLAVETGKAFPVINTTSVGSYFVQVAVSDGTFYPRHSIATTTFYNSNHGHPELFSTTGSLMDYLDYGYGIASNRGPTYNGGHYPTAVGIYEGRMAAADSGGGFDTFQKWDAYDSNYNLGAIQRGWEYYRNKGYSVVHGPYTVNRNSVTLPWGENVDMDIWLRNIGNIP